MELYTNVRVIVGFTLSMAALIILGFYSYYNNQQFIKAREAIFHTNKVLYHIEQAKSSSIKIEELTVWHLLTGDSVFLQDYTDELKQASVHFQSLKTLTIDNESQQIRLDSLRSIGYKKLELHKAIIKSRTDTIFHLPPSQLEANRKISSELNSIIGGLLEEENLLLEQRIARSEIEMKRFQATFISLIAAILIILIIVFIVVNQALRGKTLAENNMRLVNKELEAFTYSVSHDLRAPLRSIQGFSQVLKEDYGNLLDSEGDRLLGKVMRNASQMGQLIDDLLDFSRTGRKELLISTIDVQLQVNEVIYELMDSNPERKNNISVLPLQEIRADINMMKQVWINLISNALKYTRNIAEPRLKSEILNSVAIPCFIFEITELDSTCDTMKNYLMFFSDCIPMLNLKERVLASL